MGKGEKKANFIQIMTKESGFEGVKKQNFIIEEQE